LVLLSERRLAALVRLFKVETHLKVLLWVVPWALLEVV
jgi:hypothetical protein